jgi:UDP-N-acetylglucosamine--N-acetylmuramyl-(pentapeptide) pyrophosphoryl-undecaprenol N-acetylglucosamine transferase
MILLTGGGTGGHLVIVKAFKEELAQRNINPIYIGSQKGQDKTWFKDDSDFEKVYFLDSTGVMDKKGFAKIKSLFSIFIQTLKAIKIIKKHNIEKVVSVGGFSSAPASIAAVILKKDLYIHEQNSVIGKINSILKPYTKQFFSSYEGDSLVKDYPIKDVFFDTQRVRTKINTVIFLGGSQGARSINTFALSVIKKLDEMGIKIIHQTGRDDYQDVIGEYKRLAIMADVFVFSKNLEEKIAQADFAISRSGASTLWELCANGVPTLFVPYPYASADHQYYNAKFITDKDMGFVARENELNEDMFFDIVENTDIKTISEKLIDSTRRAGTKNIIDIVIKD